MYLRFQLDLTDSLQSGISRYSLSQKFSEESNITATETPNLAILIYCSRKIPPIKLIFQDPYPNSRV